MSHINYIGKQTGRNFAKTWGTQIMTLVTVALEKDPIWSQAEDLHDLPSALLERLRHYFETYKLSPDDPTPVSIGPEYDAQHAETVIRAAMDDYQEAFGEAE